MSEFYIVSVKWSRRTDKYITFWRPDDKGYAYPLSWSGKYSADNVMAHLGYYNNGDDTIAVPVEIVDPLSVAPEPGWIDNDAGPVVKSNAANWNLLIANTIVPPKHVPRPEYRGAPRRREAA